MSTKISSQSINNLGIRMRDLIEKTPDLPLSVPKIRITCYIGNNRTRLLWNIEIARVIRSAVSGLSYCVPEKIWLYQHGDGAQYMISRTRVKKFVKEIIDANCEGHKYNNIRIEKIVSQLEGMALLSDQRKQQQERGEFGLFNYHRRGGKLFYAMADGRKKRILYNQ